MLQLTSEIQLAAIHVDYPLDFHYSSEFFLKNVFPLNFIVI